MGLAKRHGVFQRFVISGAKAFRIVLQPREEGIAVRWPREGHFRDEEHAPRGDAKLAEHDGAEHQATTKRRFAGLKKEMR